MTGAGGGGGTVDSAAGSGTRLRLARVARGFSQQQLAGMAGVSRQAVSAIESGLSDPSLRVALALARALGLTVEEVFGPGGEPSAVAARPVAPLGSGRVTLAPIGESLRGAAAGRADREPGRIPARGRTGHRRSGRVRPGRPWRTG